MKTSSFIFAIVLLSTFAFSCAVPIIAQGADYTPLAPLPNTLNTTDNTTADLSTYLPGIFKLLIAIAGGLAALVMVIGGVQYLSTDAISGKEEGLERVNNALVGLLLAIASWLILNTINPSTLNFNLSLQRISAPTAVTGPPDADDDGDGIINSIDQCPNTPAGDPVNAQGCPLSAAVMCMGAISGTMVPCSCPDTECTVIGSAGTGNYSSIPLKAGAGDRVATSLADRLVVMNTGFSATGFTWYVSEAWKPTVNHQNNCHRLATCIDANISSPTAANIKTFIQRAQLMSNLVAVYEVPTLAIKQQLVSAGVPSSNCRASSPGVCVVTAITAPHFSVYCSSCTRTAP
ncbi:MAG: hypothetical protein A2741_00990 [Candidatus Zambryskibacteria bacterium RIFCSPHIGHO2_01_FULL_43_27]|uniref:Uncharacterized protein n=1 Tax=Candidatus Zambryskibacteria bacterium RIFCSPLOWO2_01_FULL_43_17 TaxID=1802760 RepID=A0A1G2U550_9BACT|nr:MAG: hypothetical protein A2741_00990 [Candidatus Zambryskibacteria bacterium RIFCSPHIGHO2_01_FULL_43_27]OHB00078.1 MAG: hypothetical protein A3E93_01985 [Candidatus Zambryskibacteria bacterium RIFCSPHIGHO2_12_FULL_43_12b]OHB04608.1 MAG: hypothetical protein A2920_01570 [Candidatus Zambryskibacteria bacterium RIFCSPLOWO2_01_FULL_43_17]